MVLALNFSWIVAIIALIAVGYVKDATGTPAQVLASGVAEFMSKFGIPTSLGSVFVILAFSICSTSLILQLE